MNALSQSAPSVWSEVSSPTRGERGGRPGVVFREKQVSFEKTSYSRPACRRRAPSAPRKDATLSHASMAAASAVAAVAVPRAMRAGAFPAGFRRRRRRPPRRACRRARRRRSLSHRPAWLRETRAAASPRRASLDLRRRSLRRRASVARSRDRHARRSTDGTQRREPPRSAPTLVDVQRRHHHHPIIRRPSQVRASPPPARLAAASWRPRPPPSTPPPTALSPAR